MPLVNVDPAEVESLRELKKDLELDGYEVVELGLVPSGPNGEAVSAALVARAKRSPRMVLVAAARSFLRASERVELTEDGECEVSAAEYEAIQALSSTLLTFERRVKVSPLPRTLGDAAHVDFARSSKDGLDPRRR